MKTARKVRPVETKRSEAQKALAQREKLEFLERKRRIAEKLEKRAAVPGENGEPTISTGVPALPATEGRREAADALDDLGSDSD